MIYHTIRIDRANVGYVATDYQSTIDRVEMTTYPHNTGWYHYPSNMPTREAFEELRRCMIKERKRAIEILNRQIVELLSLKLKVEEVI